MDIIDRETWGAAGAKSISPMKQRLDRIFAHWLGPSMPEQMSDIQILQSVQRYHQEHKEWSDIAYSWAIGREVDEGGRAKVYGGRGLRVSGAHTFTENDDSYGIVFLIGEDESYTSEMWQAFTDLVEHIRLNHRSEPMVAEAIVVMGHRHDKQVDGKGTSTTCPGSELAAKVWEYNHARDYRPYVVAPSTPEVVTPVSPPSVHLERLEALERRADLLEIEQGVLREALNRVINTEGVREVFYRELRRLAGE